MLERMTSPPALKTHNRRSRIKILFQSVQTQYRLLLLAGKREYGNNNRVAFACKKGRKAKAPNLSILSNGSMTLLLQSPASSISIAIAACDVSTVRTSFHIDFVIILSHLYAICHVTTDYAVYLLWINIRLPFWIRFLNNFCSMAFTIPLV